MKSYSFNEALSGRIEKMNEELLRFLPKEEGLQKLIFEACNYSVENGGKRIRPLLMECAYFLCRLAAEEKEQNAEQTAETAQGAAGDRSPAALYARWQADYETLLAPFLAAIEMIHSSSLVHDDLPCMDNDTLRRGKPSTWAKYGEDMGTLAGDGLMIYAFETACKAMNLMETKKAVTAEGGPGNEAASAYVSQYVKTAGERACRVLNAVNILAQKTGIYGMIGGQTVDVSLTGRKPSEEQLDFIYRLKTGALLEASVMIGAVLAGADEDTIGTLRVAASELGMAFQIQDDILDETGTEAELGKPVGSDERNEKTTYVTYYGLERSKADVKAYTERALGRIFGIADYPFFAEFCSYLTERNH